MPVSRTNPLISTWPQWCCYSVGLNKLQALQGLFEHRHTYLKYSFMICSGWWAVLISDCTFTKSSLWSNRACLLYYTEIHIALAHLVIIRAQKETSLFWAPKPEPLAQGKWWGCPGLCSPSQHSPFELWGTAAPSAHSSPVPEAVPIPANTAGTAAAASHSGGEEKEEIARNNLSDYMRQRIHSLK